MTLIGSEFPLESEIHPHAVQPPIMEISNVYKTFRYANTKEGGDAQQEHVVLDGVNLNIKKGEFVTIVGPSGCGKSTLLNIIAGLDSADSGSVIVKGKSDTNSLKRIVIFQEGALFPWLSVRENVEFGLRFTNTPKEKSHETSAKHIEMVGLTKFSESFVHQLSGGMKQRVAIARALAMDPEVLLMDEPFAALDIQTRDSLHEELVGIHKTTGKTILFVTHNINEAILLGDRVIVLSSSSKNIKKEFAIDLPRPRDAEIPELHEVKRQVLKEFQGDLQIAKRR